MDPIVTKEIEPKPAGINRPGASPVVILAAALAMTSEQNAIVGIPYIRTKKPIKQISIEKEYAPYSCWKKSLNKATLPTRKR